jgi:hypothetical protein
MAGNSKEWCGERRLDVDSGVLVFLPGSGSLGDMRQSIVLKSFIIIAGVIAGGGLSGWT